MWNVGGWQYAGDLMGRRGRGSSTLLAESASSRCPHAPALPQCLPGTFRGPTPLPRPRGSDSVSRKKVCVPPQLRARASPCTVHRAPRCSARKHRRPRRTRGGPARSGSEQRVAATARPRAARLAPARLARGWRGLRSTQTGVRRMEGGDTSAASEALRRPRSTPRMGRERFGARGKAVRL